MKRMWLVLALTVVLVLAAAPLGHALTYNAPQKISNNATSVYPQINGSGQVVWQGWDGDDREIYLFDPTTGTATNISQRPEHHDGEYNMNDLGQVVWQGRDGDDWEIYLFDPTDETVTNISQRDGYGDSRPQINDLGQVVWSGWDENDLEIYLYDGGGPAQNISTRDGIHDSRPKIANSGHVVWESIDEVFRYDPISGTAQNISSRAGRDFKSQINNIGQVIWLARDGSDPGIYYFDGSSTQRISPDHQEDDDLEWNPQINDASEVVWQGRYGTVEGIYVWDGISATNISAGFSGWEPQLNDRGDVVWGGEAEAVPGDSSDIFVWDGTTTVNVTQTEESLDHAPQINNSGAVIWRGWDGDSFEVYLATPMPEIADLLTAFDEAVSSGDLQGTGSGPWAPLRLEALRNVLLQAQSLADAGATGGACARLDFAYRRIDGDPKPPDLATGPAAPEIAEMILDVKASLGCY